MDSKQLQKTTSLKLTRLTWPTQSKKSKTRHEFDTCGDHLPLHRTFHYAPEIVACCQTVGAGP